MTIESGQSGSGGKEAVRLPGRSNALARALGHPRLFRMWERLGLHVMPIDCYQPVPHSRTLRESLWTGRSAMGGVRVDLDAQEALLADLCARFGSEFDDLASRRDDGSGRYHMRNSRFESVDAELLYGLVRRGKPRRIVEIGTGYSTLLALEALGRNEREGGPRWSMLTVDPFPPVWLRGRAGVEIRACAVQDVPLSEFESLEAGDILFIDSTHVLAIGSDVQYEFLEVVPRVKPGVLVHVHDIFLPAEYPRNWVLGWRRYWTEQYLLQAFLAFNPSFETIWAGHMMHMDRSAALGRLLKSYDPASVEPGSWWMRRVG